MINRNLTIISLMILMFIIPSGSITAAQIHAFSSGKNKFGTADANSESVQIQPVPSAEITNNLALNKSYTTTAVPHPDFPDDGNESTDGILAVDYADGKSYAYAIRSGENKKIEVIIDLDSVVNIGSVIVHKWEGIYPYGADTITVSTSIDGTTFVPFASTPSLDGVWYTFSSEIISSRYVKVRFTKYNNDQFGHDWLFINEIQVYQNEKAANDAKQLNSFNKVLDKNISAVYASPTFENDRTVYAISDNQLYRSQDGGEEWEELTIFIDYVHYTDRDQYLFNMLCEGNGVVYLSGYYAYFDQGYNKYDFFLIKSTDGGNHWHQLFDNAFYNLVMANDTLFGINNNTGYLQKSNDKGSTWTWPLKSQKELRNFAFATTDGQNFWNIYDKKLWSSKNGFDWEPYSNINSDATRIYAYANKGQYILITCNPDRIREGSISTDNTTWQAIDFSSIPQAPQANLYCADSAGNGIIVLGIADKSVLISRDYGQTWKMFAGGLSAPAPYIKCALQEDLLYVFAGTSKGLFRLKYPIK